MADIPLITCLSFGRARYLFPNPHQSEPCGYGRDKADARTRETINTNAVLQAKRNTHEDKDGDQP